MNRKVYTTTAALVAGCIAAATASAQAVIQREYGVTSGAVSAVSIANLKANWVVTGVRNGSGNLEVITWESNGSQLTRKGSAGAGAMGKVAITDLSASRVVTAVTNGSGNLELIVWSVSSTGAVTREGDFVGEAVNTVDIARLSSSRVITAVEGSDGNLTLNVWGVDSSGTITPQGSVTDGAVTKAHIACMSNSQAVTAVQTSAGNLQLSSWKVDSSGNITHQSDASKGTITQVGLTPWYSAGHLGTAVRNGQLHLEVLDWMVDATTGAITLQASNSFGTVSKVTVSTIGPDIFTVANASGTLQVGVWGYYGSPDPQFQEIVGHPYDAVTGVAAAAPLNTGAYTVTASENSSGNLELSVWTWFIIH